MKTNFRAQTKQLLMNFIRDQRGTIKREKNYLSSTIDQDNGT